MCTRDRATGNYIDLGVLGKYTVKDGVYTLTDAAETDGADLTAVSYTHLDVYKRQLLYPAA